MSPLWDYTLFAAISDGYINVTAAGLGNADQLCFVYPDANPSGLGGRQQGNIFSLITPLSDIGLGGFFEPLFSNPERVDINIERRKI